MCVTDDHCHYIGARLGKSFLVEVVLVKERLTKLFVYIVVQLPEYSLPLAIDGDDLNSHPV